MKFKIIAHFSQEVSDFIEGDTEEEAVAVMNKMMRESAIGSIYNDNVYVCKNNIY